jgi:phosphoserine phosphatase
VAAGAAAGRARRGRAARDRPAPSRPAEAGDASRRARHAVTGPRRAPCRRLAGPRGPAQIRRKARAQIAADRAAGYRIVVATAAYRFYAEAIARDIAADALIATSTAIDPRGHLLPRIEGGNCYGPAKRAMIAAWLAAQGIDRSAAHIRFYSDHVSDVPSFDWADEPVAVNPHAALRRVAAERGWPIVDWNG